jgi:hypothetical protein
MSEYHTNDYSQILNFSYSFDGFDNIMLLDFQKFVEHKATCERGFQKSKSLPGIEPASSVVDDSNPLPPDRQG